jgi:hypothetical protein
VLVTTLIIAGIAIIVATPDTIMHPVVVISPLALLSSARYDRSQQ